MTTRCANSAATASSDGWEMSQALTLAPSAVNLRAAASPIPEAAPVTTAN
jgi:hypothetical protein